METNPIFIIAEMAWSHNGSVDHALTIVQGASQAGSDALGIHLTSLPDYMVRDYRGVAGRTVSNTGSAPTASVYDYLERISLNASEWEQVIGAARGAGLKLVTMCNDEPSVDLAENIGGVDYHVIAAACFTEYGVIRKIAKTGRPLILRIGGATMSEIETVVRVARDAGAEDVSLLHGIQLYPTPLEQLNLAAIPRLSAAFGCPVGLADHIDGRLPEAITLPTLAIPYGATIIEKHITIDRALKLEDYEAALGIEQFADFVRYVRVAELALGSGEPGANSAADQDYRTVSRKRTVARRPIRSGSVITGDDIAFKRSDSGFPVERAGLLIGRRMIRDLSVDEGVELEDSEAV